MADLRATDDQEVQAELGRCQLAPLLLLHSRDILDDVLKLAKRDNRMRRCLGAARYYSGLNADICARIDDVLHHPFPGAKRR
jgi:hypothetical protein